MDSFSVCKQLYTNVFRGWHYISTYCYMILLEWRLTCSLTQVCQSILSLSPSRKAASHARILMLARPPAAPVALLSKIKQINMWWIAWFQGVKTSLSTKHVVVNHTKSYYNKPMAIYSYHLIVMWHHQSMLAVNQTSDSRHVSLSSKSQKPKEVSLGPWHPCHPKNGCFSAEVRRSIYKCVYIYI